MPKLEEKIRSLEPFKAIQNYLPDNHSLHQSMKSYCKQISGRFPGTIKVLDLGCGEGHSIKFFESIPNEIEWHGVDIEDSPEVRQRNLERSEIQTFDGINLPYANNYFDLIYCNQVLEHVRFPDPLIADALRVLRPGGQFIGSVSYLEPHHSYSIFNFTPYALARIFTDAGYELKEIRPGFDASFFINRQLLNRSKKLRLLWSNNYIHGIIELMGMTFRLTHREKNFLKVQFSGNLLFLAQRPENVQANNPPDEHRTASFQSV